MTATLGLSDAIRKQGRKQRNADRTMGMFWGLNKHKTQQDSWSETGMIGSPEEESEGA
jgi:hypothetical protein